MKFSGIKKFAIVSLVIVSMVVAPLGPLSVHKANAQPVPTECGLLDVYCIMDNWKEFVGNKLAVMIANQLIQKMTASVVNWINTGFDGNPSFLQDPEGFFLDVGDQITGEFLEETRTQVLCTPFSYDLRLNIALNRAQSNSFSKRYQCTLGSIIQQNRNALQNGVGSAGIVITDDPNGATLGDFMNGDFSQGGWEGWLAYTTQAQNNPVGATLMSNSDLQQRIAVKKAAVNADLNRGQGFLSWQKCTDVTSDYLDPSLGGESLGLTLSQEAQMRQFGERTVITGQTNLDKPTSVKKVKDKNGIVSYQNCQTQTPGSAIASTLFNAADTPREKLVLVKTISDSIDAITGALVNQMLTQGLAALSGNGSGVGGSSRAYLTQLNNESYNRNSYDAQSYSDRAANSSNPIIRLAQSSLEAYEKILTDLGSVRNKYVAARSCFTMQLSKLDQTTHDNQRNIGQRYINGIDLVISTNIDPLIASTSEKKILAQNAINGYQDSAREFADSNVIYNDINAAFSRVDSSVNNTSQAARSGVDNSLSVSGNSNATTEMISNLNKDADTLQSICNQLPYNTGFQYQFYRLTNPLLNGIH